MKIRAITPQNDWMFGQGQGSYATDQAAIAENVKTRLQEWLGDCFWAQQNGIDWANLLGYGKLQALKLALDTTILQSYGVVNLTSSSFTLDRATRKATFNYQIETIYSSAFTGLLNLIPILQGAS